MLPRIAVCMTSYDRIDCARINQEIFKLNFTHSYILIHATSGINAEPYLEDVFVRTKPKPHFLGERAKRCSLLIVPTMGWPFAEIVAELSPSL